MIELTVRLEANINLITEQLGNSSDICIRRMEPGDGPKAAIVFLMSLIDQTLVDQFVIQETNHWNSLSVSVQHTVNSVEEAAEQLLQGYSLVLVDGEAMAIAAATNGGDRRSVSEPSAESVVRGPREAFNESMQTNIGLVRRRLVTPKLRIIKLSLGAVTNTAVSFMYLDGIAKPQIVAEVKRRLESIQIDGILESQYIEEMIEDRGNGYTPFPTIFNTERPDRVAAALLEGQVAVLMEGTPVALVLPATISAFLYSNEDYYQRFDIASFLKLLRTLTFLISFLLPGFYVSLLTFHQEMIPSPLLIALTGQREGVPFGIAIEVFLMEMTFEILREAGIRLPKTIGSAVSIVGGLVLGQAAVEAGLVAPGTVIAVSATAISSFCTPSYNMAIAARLIRFLLIFLSALLGAFGLFFGLILLVIHLNSIRSVGVPYLSPIVPFHWKSWRDLFIRVPWWAMKQRPEETAVDQQRMPVGAGSGKSKR
jgi:spore germination protein KA